MIQRKRLLFQKWFTVIWFFWMLFDLVIILSDFPVSNYYSAMRPIMFIMMIGSIIMPVNEETKNAHKAFIISFFKKLLPFSYRGRK